MMKASAVSASLLVPPAASTRDAYVSKGREGYVPGFRTAPDT